MLRHTQKTLWCFWSIWKEIAAFFEKVTLFLFLLQDEGNMHVAFLVHITSHFNEINWKQQGKNNSVCDLMAANPSKGNWKRFKEDIQRECENFPKLQEQIQSVYVVTIDKMVGKFNKRFDLTTSVSDHSSSCSSRIHSSSEMSKKFQKRWPRASSGLMLDLDRWNWLICKQMLH